MSICLVEQSSRPSRFSTEMQINRRRGFACVVVAALALGAASFGTSRSFAKTLAPPRSITVADGPALLNAGDFNEDGIQDLAIAINRTNEIGIVFGKRNGKLRRIERYAFDGLVTSAAVGDFNSDGHDDVAATFGFSSNDGVALGVLVGDGNGGFRRGPDSVVAPAGDCRPADINGDDRTDLVGFSSFVGTALGNGDGTFRDPAIFDIGAAAGTLAIGDVNGDGADDVARPDNALQTLTVLLGDPVEVLVKSQTILTPDALVSAAAFGDVTGDAIPDLIVTYLIPFEIHVFRGNGDGTFVATPIRSPAPPDVADLEVGDLSGDGRLDVVSQSTNATTLNVLVGRGDGTFEAPLFAGSMASPHGLALADFTGDQRLDIAALDFDNSTLTTVVNLGPSVTSVAGKGAGSSFSLRIKGKLFEPGARILIGGNETEWTQVVAGGSTSLTLKGGAALEALFPAGFPISIRVVNPDGWQIRTTFTRSASDFF